MIESELLIANRLGLHARAAAKFVHGPEDDSAFGGSVPEPASLSLLAAALVGIAARRR